ncbi:hypothetical protein Poly30_06490 [Planctomycetes bacterium Poly30]|uniref:Tetratricopeptide repeat protein n=1 Tax=Saltatorellus ferox TaxID=2528018 RepID=A0A518EM51_9BACT|nr:hypothetical protein Poly30_06490 [Planctomycetes bacterium Poly30]
MTFLTFSSALSAACALAVPITLYGATAQAPPSSAPAPVEATSTPASDAIEVARTALNSGEPSAAKHVALATAYSRRARETAGPEWYDRSDEELVKALELAPDDFAALRMQIWNQLGRHEFQDAYTAALALNLRAKDDVLTYGLIVDAAMELGRYEEAENAAQWMLNLRPGTPIAMTRVSYLREQFGDIRGSIEAMLAAFHSTRPSDAEDAAWILTHLAHLELERGDTKAAKDYAGSALILFPDYHYALGVMGDIFEAEGDHESARTRLAKRYEVASHPENLYRLAVATEAAGATEEAETMFAEFEKAALAESENVDNANLELVEYWTDHVGSPEAIARALELVSKRARRRSDVPTLSALAWSQHRAGDSKVAWDTISKALAVGSVNARLRFRAGEIALAAGHPERAEEQYQIAMQTAPRSRFGREALEAIKRLPARSSAE